MRRLLIVISLACLECGLFPSLDYLSSHQGAGGGGERDGGTGGGTSSGMAGSGTGGAIIDAGDAGGGKDAGDAGDASPGPCASTEGPTMAPFTINHLDGGTTQTCIDTTEVTRAQYAKFLKLKGSDMSGQPAPCTGNDKYGEPGFAVNCTFELDETSPQPVTCIDWCDARAYCEWAGKRLCGAVGGGLLDITKHSVKEGEWFKVCSSNNEAFNLYPYGSTYDPARCNGADRDAGATLPVGTLPDCQGPDGIHDLSGNVKEYTGGLSEDMNFAAAMGGGWQSGADELRCQSYMADWFNRGFPDVGFRCCKDP